jgi:hypothetical protein
MSQKPRKTRRVSADINVAVLTEWEDAMKEYYDTFANMLSQSQRVELALVAPTRLMQSDGGNILPPRSPRKQRQGVNHEHEQGKEPEQSQNAGNGGKTTDNWQDSRNSRY